MGHSEPSADTLVAALLSCKNLFSAHLPGFWLMVLMQVPVVMLLLVCFTMPEAMGGYVCVQQLLWLWFCFAPSLHLVL